MSRRSRPTWIDPTILYSRQEIAERVGLSDDVLSYWIKRGILIPEPQEGSGKGVHYRFHLSQVGIAVVLKALRDHFGANIGTLKSLADTLQRGCDLFRKTKAPVSAWAAAVHLADRLARFRQGERFEVLIYDSDTDEVVRKIAESEIEIIQECLDIRDDPPNVILSLVSQIGPGHQREYEIALAILGKPLEPRYSDSAWLLAKVEDDWVIYGNIENAIESCNVGPAMFLPASRMVGEAWGIPPVLRDLDLGLRIEAVAADYGMNVSVTYEDGRVGFDGPDAKNPNLELLIERYRAPDHWIERAGIEPIKNKHTDLYWTRAHQQERGAK